MAVIAFDRMVAVAWVCGGIVVVSCAGLVHTIRSRRRHAQLTRPGILPVHADTTLTSIRPGPNGRPVYQSKPVPHAPVRTQDLRQRHASLKLAWKRLSRPFTAAPTEMPQISPKALRKSSFTEKFDDISPVTPLAMDRRQSPVSPINMRDLHFGLESKDRATKNKQNLKTTSKDSPRFEDVPLTPDLKASETPIKVQIPDSGNSIPANMFEKTKKLPAKPSAARLLNTGSQRGFATLPH